MPRNSRRSSWERTSVPAACLCTFNAKEDEGLSENNDKLANANKKWSYSFWTLAIALLASIQRGKALRFCKDWMRKKDMRQAGQLMLIVSYAGIPNVENISLWAQLSNLSS